MLVYLLSCGVSRFSITCSFWCALVSVMTSLRCTGLQPSQKSETYLTSIWLTTRKNRSRFLAQLRAPWASCPLSRCVPATLDVVMVMWLMHSLRSYPNQLCAKQLIGCCENSLLHVVASIPQISLTEGAAVWLQACRRHISYHPCMYFK